MPFFFIIEKVVGLPITLSPNPSPLLGFRRPAPEPLGPNIGLQYDDGDGRKLRHPALRPIRQLLVRHKSKPEL